MPGPGTDQGADGAADVRGAQGHVEDGRGEQPASGLLGLGHGLDQFVHGVRQVEAAQLSGRDGGPHPDLGPVVLAQSGQPPQHGPARVVPVLPEVAQDGRGESLTGEAHRAHRDLLGADLLRAEFGDRAGGDQPGVDAVAEQRAAGCRLRIDGDGQFPGEHLGGLGDGAERGPVQDGDGDPVGRVP